MTFPRPAASVLLTGLLTFALIPPCVAQGTVATNVPKPIKLTPENTIPYGQRTDAFRRLLYEFRFTPIRSADDLLAEPNKSILIVFGDTECLSNGHLPEGLLPFVQRGGAVLIATDRAIQNRRVRENVAKLAGVRVTGEKLWLPDGADRYENQPYCPFVQPITASTPLGDSSNLLGALAAVVGTGSRPDLFRNPQPNQDPLRVATNAPSQLQPVSWWGLPAGIHRLAQLPSGSVQENLIVAPARGRGTPTPPLFAVGGTVGAGRVLVLADHSIFINRMILMPNNKNLEFTANCLHWLRGGASTSLDLIRAAKDPQAMQRLAGQRDRVLFWDEGEICPKFEVPLRTVPLKPSLDMGPALVAAIDQTLAKMEERDEFNRGMLDWADDLPGGRPQAVRNAVYLLTLLGILLLGYFFLWRGRFRQESAVPLLAHALSQHEPRASVLELRRRALLRSGNVWELAHQLARQYFESAGVALTSRSAPRVSAQGSWWQRWRVRRRVARLWQLARGDAPVRIPPAALNLWLRDLEELKIALAKGTITLI
jgi:hypothetical protein